MLSKQKNGYEEENYYKEFYKQGMREALIELKQQFVNNYYGGDLNSIEEDKTFEIFCEEQGYDNGSTPTPGRNLLKLVFQCVKNNYDDNFIRENYTGKWIADLFVDESSWDDYRGLLPTSSEIFDIIFSVRTVDETGGMEYFQEYCSVLMLYPAFVNGNVVIDAESLAEIQALSNQTGIDIISLSEKSYISEFGEILEYHTKRVVSQEIPSGYFSEIVNMIEIAMAENNQYKLMEYYSTIGVALYEYSTLNLEELEIGDDVYTFYTPTANFENLFSSTSILFTSIGNDYPEFYQLDPTIQNQLISDAIWLHNKNNGKLDTGPLEDKRDRRLLRAGLACTAAMILCVPLGAAGVFFGVLCIASANAALHDKIDEIWEDYYRDVRDSKNNKK